MEMELVAWYCGHDGREGGRAKIQYLSIAWCIYSELSNAWSLISDMIRMMWGTILPPPTHTHLKVRYVRLIFLSPHKIFFLKVLVKVLNGQASLTFEWLLPVFVKLSHRIYSGP